MSTTTELKELTSKLSTLDVERSKLIEQISQIEDENDPVTKLFESLRSDIEEYNKETIIKQTVVVPCNIELSVDSYIRGGEFQGSISWKITGIKPKQSAAIEEMFSDAYMEDGDYSMSDLCPEFKKSIDAAKKAHDKIVKKAQDYLKRWD